MEKVITLVLDGLDVSGLVAPEGFKAAFNVIDSKESGRNDSDAEMQRAIVSDKENYSITFPALTQQESQDILQKARKPFIRVDISSPAYGLRQNVEFYITPGTLTAATPALLPRNRGTRRWKDFTIELVER